MTESPENQLADLGFQNILPHPALRPFVQSYWVFQRDKPLLTLREEYMHPQGGYGLVFNFGDSQRLDTETPSEPVFLDGANSRSRKMAFFGHIHLMGIRFHTGGAYPFLNVPLVELRNAVVALDALDRLSLMALYGRLYDADTLSERISLIENWLLGRLAQNDAPDSIIAGSLGLLRADDSLSIPDLADKLAISQRQLERLYQVHVGISPKQYTQLLRVETARLTLKQVNDLSNTRLAVDLGFYDQAHFIRQFRAVIGMTPYRYMQRSRQREQTTE